MRRFAFVLAALAAMLPSAARSTEWTGFYVGGSGSFNSYSSLWTDVDNDWFGGTLETYEEKAGVVLQTGYNRQFGAVVYGLELDYRPGSIIRTTRWANDVNKTDKIGNVVTLRARMGAALGEGLLYGAVGAAQADVLHEWIEDLDEPDSWRSIHNSQIGLAYGMGYERRFMPRLSVRLEFLRVVMPRIRAANPLGYQAEISDTLESASVGLNFHF